MVAIANAIQSNKTLRSVDISGTNITNDGTRSEALVALGKMLSKNDTLTHLSLSNNSLTDYGACPEWMNPIAMSLGEDMCEEDGTESEDDEKVLDGDAVQKGSTKESKQSKNGRKLHPPEETKGEHPISDTCSSMKIPSRYRKKSNRPRKKQGRKGCSVLANLSLAQCHCGERACTQLLMSLVNGKNLSLTHLDLSGNSLLVGGAKVLADCLRGTIRRDSWLDKDVDTEKRSKDGKGEKDMGGVEGENVSPRTAAINYEFLFLGPHQNERKRKGKREGGLESLRYLDISDNNIAAYGDDYSAVEALAFSLTQNTTLKTLIVSRNRLNDQSIRSFLRALR